MEKVAEVVEARGLGDFGDRIVRFLQQPSGEVDAGRRHVFGGCRVQRLLKGANELGGCRLADFRQTLEREFFRGMGVDGIVAETPQGEIGIRDGKLFVDFKGVAPNGTSVLKAADLFAFTQGEKIGCAFVWSRDGKLIVYARGSRVATLTSDYVPAKNAAQSGDLVLGSAATGDLNEVRITASALSKKDLLQQVGLAIIIR